MERSPGTRPFEIGPIEGKSERSALGFQPTVVTAAMAAAPMAPRLPRPTRSRLPIDAQTFELLKSAARAEKQRLSRKLSRLTFDPSEAGMLPAAPRAWVREGGGPGGPRGMAPGAPTGPSVQQSFAGIPHTGWLPYDCAMAAGRQHVLLTVNSTVAIYPRAGGAPLAQRSLDHWFLNVVQGATVFDPRAAYDHFADRWILLATAYNAAGGSWFLLSVSQSADPLAGWHNYALDAKVDGTRATNNWADYPCLGYDGNALYVTANMFQLGANGGFAYTKLRVLDKSPVYAGVVATYRDIAGLRNRDGSLAFTVQPCTQFDAGDMPMVNTIFPTAANPSPSEVTLWSVAGAPNAPVLTRRTVQTDPYAIPPQADQPGGAAPLDSGDIRLMNAVCRNGSVWTCLATRETWDDGTNTAAVHWMEITRQSAAIAQESVYGARGRHYFYPGLAVDAAGNMVLGFTRASTSEFASFYAATRKARDAAGALAPSMLLQAGSSAYTGLDAAGRNRWGDYMGTGADPQDPSQLWVFGGWASGASTWATWVAAVTP